MAGEEREEQRRVVRYVNVIGMDGWTERAVVHAREGNKVYLRGVDPCDPEPEPIPVYEGDELIPMPHFSDISHHTRPEGTEGFVLSQRIVPVREEPGRLVARTLRFGEEDDGRRCHVRPGDTLAIELVLELDFVDEWEGRWVDGYVALTPVLFSWLSFGTSFSDEFRRYLLAAARRLDQAQSLFIRVDELRQSDPEGAPAVRRAVFDLVGATELAVVSLGRAVDMCVQANDTLGTSVEVPESITSRQQAIKAIRNAYEHIEDRALGNVYGVPHADALTIFDHGRVAGEGVISYGSHELDLATDVPAVMAAVRQYLKDVAGTSPLTGTTVRDVPSPPGEDPAASASCEEH